MKDVRQKISELKNRLDMRESMINACIGVLDHYRNELSEEQHRELSLILKSLG